MVGEKNRRPSFFGSFFNPAMLITALFVITWDIKDLHPFCPGLIAQLHQGRDHLWVSSSGLFRGAVSFAGVTLPAGQYAVGLGGLTTLGARHNVVDCQLVATRLSATVLACETVTLEHVSSAKGHRCIRKSIEGG